MNRLQYETSPYLIQHASNPVDWFPWCDEAFAKAQKEDKPVLVSIGYAACHWCHVMEHESFEDENVAAFMNEHFVCIKVDREEHPDVDHFYMDALIAMTGQGGWPLNMFVKPDRTPFYGGTYFPPKPIYQRASWIDVLHAIHKSWQERKEDIDLQSQQLVMHLKNAASVSSQSGKKFDKQTIDEIAEKLHRQADLKDGGFGKAPKFPATMAIQFLLEHFHFTKNKTSLEIALLSLDKMIAGGIYDQIGGGFARYSTDAKWLAPHFEKMLYDNALLIDVLCDAFQITKKEQYQTVIDDTIAFCLREMKNEEGLFYAAIDADSEGVEGKYYTWAWEEWKQALPAANPAVIDYFGVSENGNWEHTNILHQSKNETDILSKYQLSKSEWQTILLSHKKQLLQARALRVRPATDDKILLSWNALMNTALVKAAKVFHRDDYLQIALNQMNLLLQKMKNADGDLYHTYKNGMAKIPAKLDDYAYLIEALWQLAGISGNEKFILEAQNFMQMVTENFKEDKSDFFYFSSKKQNDIPVRKIDTTDSAVPSANAVMFQNLWMLGNLLEDESLTEQSFAMLQTMMDHVSAYPLSFSRWATLAQRYIKGYKQIIIAGDMADADIKLLYQNFIPEVYTYCQKQSSTDIPAFVDKYKDGKTLFYLCENFSCKQPLHRIQDLLEELKF